MSDSRAILKVIGLATKGLLTGEGHHKQWYLEQILETCGQNLGQLRNELQKADYDWEDGIAP